MTERERIILGFSMREAEKFMEIGGRTQARMPLNLRRESQVLVLSRQRDEVIMIGDNIEVTVVDIRGDKVRVGINAPKEIAVHRKEVYDAIRRQERIKKSGPNKKTA